MQKVKIRKPVKGYKLGDVYTVKNNEAHRLIDGGYAELYTDTSKKEYEDRMMSSSKKKSDKDLGDWDI